MKKCAPAGGATACLVVLVTACSGNPTSPFSTSSLPPSAVETSRRAPPDRRLAIDAILAFGDSITEGFVSPAPGILLAVQPGNSYPAKLEALLRERFVGQDVRVANRGRGGEDASDGRGRFLQVFTETQPNLVILLEGINDINLALAVSGSSGKPVPNELAEEIVTDIRWMARSAQVRGATVFVVLLTPIGDVYAREQPQARSIIASVNNGLRVVAAGIGAVVIDLDVALGGGQLIGQDGVHPTVPGYQRMAEALFSEIVRRFDVVGVVSVGSPTPDDRPETRDARGATARPALPGDRAIGRSLRSR